MVVASTKAASGRRQRDPVGIARPGPTDGLPRSHPRFTEGRGSPHRTAGEVVDPVAILTTSSTAMIPASRTTRSRDDVFQQSNYQLLATTKQIHEFSPVRSAIREHLL
jgi:hypothetical protein